MATENANQQAGKKQGGFLAWYYSYKGQRIVGMVYSVGAAVVIVGALFKIQHWAGATYMLTAGMLTEAILFTIGVFDKPHPVFHWHNVFPQLVEEEGSEPNFYAEIQKMPRPNLAAVTGGVAPMAAANAGSAAEKANVPALTDKDLEALKGGIADLAKTAGQLSELGKVATSTTKLGEKLDAASEAAAQFTASQAGLVQATSTLGNAATALGNTYTTVANDMQNVVANTKVYGQNVEAAGQKLSALNSIYELQINAAQAQADAYKAQAQKVGALAADVEKLQMAQAEALKNGEAYQAATKKLAEQVADLNKVYGNMLNALA